jgi:DEAD/DEAH box helicase domain-containing protein
LVGLAGNVLALDIETKNFAHEIGGWGNTHMFLPSVVCTWDGDVGTVYIDKAVDDLTKGGTVVKSLRQLKFDLDDHIQKGGILLGHNLAAFDLPVLRDSMDIFCINKYFNKKAYIDTSREVSTITGQRFSLSNLVKHTLGDAKTMDSADAPVIWKEGKYSEVAEYCLKDCQLVYDLWKHGKDEGFVKGYSIDDEEERTLEVDW